MNEYDELVKSVQVLVLVSALSCRAFLYFCTMLGSIHFNFTFPLSCIKISENVVRHLILLFSMAVCTSTCIKKMKLEITLFASTACIKLEEYQTAKAALEAGASLVHGDSRFAKLIRECDELIAGTFSISFGSLGMEIRTSDLKAFVCTEK